MTTFVIERQNDYISIEAERVRVDAGALIFENGDVFKPELVSIKAPGTWLQVFPRVDDECTCDHDHDDDEEED